MPTPTHHTHWSAAGPAVETTAHPRHKAWQAWLTARAIEAGLSPEEYRVAELAVVERRSVPAIAAVLKLKRQQAEKMQERALLALSALPEFWRTARQFEREIVDAAENRETYDE